MIKFIKKSILKKLFVTIGILAVYRMAMLVVIPGVDLDGIPQLSNKSSFLGTLNVFSGGSLDQCSILATNIMPYITATIVTQLFSSKSIGIDYFQKLKKDKELGDAKKNEWTQYFTVIVSLINAVYISTTLFHTYKDGASIIFFSKALFYSLSIPAMVAGSMFVVWLANQISKYGIGQGTSVIIFANIISNSASNFNKIFELYKSGTLSINNAILIILFFSILFFVVVFMESCTIFLPVKYAGITGKQAEQKMPLKINNAGVMPAVLASSFSHFPMILVGLFEKFNLQTETVTKYASYFSQSSSFYYIISAILIFLFTITQSEISFDPQEISHNLQESGAVIRDVRPGADTYLKLKGILSKLNFLSGLYLAFVCVLSEYFCFYINQSVGEKILQLSGTGVLILVSTSKLIFDGMKNYNYMEILKTMISSKDKSLLKE